MSNVTVIRGNCVEIMRGMDENSVDSICTDPPYGLQFMGKEWDRLWRDRSEADAAWTAQQEAESDGLAARRRKLPTLHSTGRDMQEWHELWAIEALRVLKPGGHLLAAGGSRTYHRMACAIEDAGFEIRDCIQWLYFSGFPKSHNISKAIDKAAGAEREVVGYDASRVRPNRLYKSGAIGNIGGGENDAICDRTDNGATITSAATPEAQQWEGWGTALKPAYEPIVVARKPLVGTAAANVMQYGTGALNIDAVRVSPSSPDGDVPASAPRSPLYLLLGRLSASPELAPDAALRIAAALRSGSTADTGPSHGVGDLDDMSLDPAECAWLRDLLYPNGAWCGWKEIPVQGSQDDCPACRRYGDERARRLLEAARESAASLADALAHMSSGQPTPSHSRCHQCNGLSSEDALVRFLSSVHSTMYSASRGREGEASADRKYTQNGATNFAASPGPRGGDAKGRWPANVILSHLPECNGECAEGCAVAELDRQTGVLTSGANPTRRGAPKFRNAYGEFQGQEECSPARGADSGFGSRFFKVVSLDEEEKLLCRAKAIMETWNSSLANTVDDSSALPSQYVVSVLSDAVTEASCGAMWLSDSKAHFTSATPSALSRFCLSAIILTLSTAEEFSQGRRQERHIRSADRVSDAGMSAPTDTTMTTTSQLRYGGYAVDVTLQVTSNSTDRGEAASSRFIYVAKAPATERVLPDGTRSNHPTMKPVDLMRYLCRLVTPPGGLVLDPFAGSGTTLVAALAEGFRAIGIEQEAEYVDLINRRLHNKQIGLGI